MKIARLVTLFETWLTQHPFLYRILKKAKVFVQRIIYFLFKLIGRDRNLIYDNTFFNQNLKTNLPMAKDLVDILDKYFHPQLVVDIGCGTAEYLAEFQKKGAKIKGYEGSKNAITKALIDNKFIQLVDLRNRINDTHRYDLAVCLEVAEHIEGRYSQTLVDNLAALSDTVIFSAASPGQGGHFHINEQPKEFWINLWQEKNYIYKNDITETLKREMKQQGILRWYYENLMVFSRAK